MKKFFRPRETAVLWSLLFTCIAAGAQEPAKPPTQTTQPGHRQTVFSRSGDAAAPSPPSAQSQPDDVTAKDEDRSAVLITSFDFDVRLLPQQNALNMRARLVIKNDSAQPLARIPLQISSSLDWLSVRLINSAGAGESVPLHVRTIDSDIDHTGQVHEDIVMLRQPLAPDATVTVEMLYAGQVILNAGRLERIGTPHDAALHADWDRVAPDFVALRGLGNILWHPAAAPAVLLGDGAKLFHEIGAWKERESRATVRTRVTLEYFGAQPNLTLFDGQRVAVDSKVDVNAEPGGPRILTAAAQFSTLGFAAPSIFIDAAQETSHNGVRVFAQPEHEERGEAWQTAALRVTPLLERWFGAERKRELLVVDLPEEADAPFALDNILFHPLRSASAGSLAPLLANSLTHGYFISPRVWLAQGVPQFISSLWTEQNSGREAALGELEAARVPLALAEPDKIDADGEPLIRASDEVYYRTKAAFVLWMLRSLMGDDALAVTLKEYRAANDNSPKYFEQLCETASHQELEWFFTDWVYRDRGLPALYIAAVNSRAVPPASYLIEVEVGNHGNAAASVPVTVRAGEASTTERIRVAARSSAVTRFVMPAKPDLVVVNDGTVPEAESSKHEQKMQ